MRPMASSRSATRGSVTTRKWSGVGQLKPVPCTTSSFCCAQQVEHEPLVVHDRVDLGVEPRERVQRALGFDAGDAGDLVEQLPRGVALVDAGGRRAAPGR